MGIMGVRTSAVDVEKKNSYCLLLRKLILLGRINDHSVDYSLNDFKYGFVSD